MEISAGTLSFIRAHIADNPAKLRLSFSGKTVEDVDIPFAITQIEARRKALRKLPWLPEYPEFMFPSTLSAEQCTAQPVADFHAKVAGKRGNLLDITCGLGIDAFAMSRVAENLIACDISDIHIECAVHNAHVLGIDNFTAVCTDAEKFLKSLAPEERFSLIFADPARRGSLNSRTYALADCTPDILKLMPELRKHAEELLIKISPMLDVRQVISEIPFVSDVYAVSLRGECKELLVKCQITSPHGHIRYKAVNIDADNNIHEFEIPAAHIAEECLAEDAVDIKPGDILFEPNASVMKFISLTSLTSVFPRLKKLSRNTHLYIGDSTMAGVDFPGRVLAVEKVLSPNKRCAGELPAQVNIVTRNYPDTPEKIKKQFRLKDGGENYLYCCKIGERTHRMLLCSRV